MQENPVLCNDVVAWWPFASLQVITQRESWPVEQSSVYKEGKQAWFSAAVWENKVLCHLKVKKSWLEVSK